MALYTLFIMTVVMTVVLLYEIHRHPVLGTHEPVRAGAHSQFAELASSIPIMCSPEERYEDSYYFGHPC
jgi:hypothetical protein